MLFKSRDEKIIFGTMNLKKKSRNGNEKRIFKIIQYFEKKSPKWLKPVTTYSRKLQISRILFKSRVEKRIFGIMNFQKKSRNGN